MGNRERVIKLERAPAMAITVANEEIDAATLEEARLILRRHWPAVGHELEAEGIPFEATRQWLVEGLSLEDALECAKVH